MGKQSKMFSKTFRFEPGKLIFKAFTFFLMAGFLLTANQKRSYAQDSNPVFNKVQLAKVNDKLINTRTNQVNSSSAILGKVISLDLVDVTLEKAFKTIAEKAGLKLSYSEYIVPISKKVSIVNKGITVNEAIWELLEGTDIRYAISPNGFLVLLKWQEESVPNKVIFQTGTITGTVVDASSGETLPGANVFLENTQKGASTDVNGDFEITGIEPGSYTIVVQFVGFQRFEQNITIDTDETVTLNIELQSEEIGLEELIVTGTAGPTERKKVVNAVDQVDVSDILERTSLNNVGDLLTGRSAGTSISPGTGIVGSGPRINIRGSSSLLLSEQPLIYVDGIRVDNSFAEGPQIQGGSVTSRLNDIDPRDIENIEIIKGPSAGTLYGTEAASGVIQITTRKGIAGEPIFSISTSQGINVFMNAKNRIPINWGEFPDTGEIGPFNILEVEEERGNKIFEPGHVQKYNASVRGGSETFRYRVSGNYDNQEGVEPTNKVDRTSVRGNFSVNPNSNWVINAGFGIVSGTTKLAREYGGSAMWGISRAQPELLDTPLRGFWSAPPEVYWDVYDTRQEYGRYNWNLNIQHSPFDWLTQRLIIGRDYIDESNEVLVNYMNEYQAQFFSASAARGSKTVDQRKALYNTVDYSATADLTVSKNFSTSTSFGFQYYSRSTTRTNASGEEFPVSGLTTVGSAARTFSGEDFVENITMGMYLQEQLSWGDKFFLTLAIRADDNSAFGTDYELVTYPKIGASWVVSDEDFMDNIDFVTSLRLRAAYGASGRQPDAFDALKTYSPTTVTGDNPGVTPGNAGNPDLGPERGEEFEIGFESTLLRDRLDIDFTFYTGKTKDAILSQDMAPSMGFPQARFINGATTSNIGFESLLNTTLYQSQKLAVDVSFVLSYNESKIEEMDLPGGEEYISLSGYRRHQVGYAPNSFFSKEIVSGVLDNNGNVANMMCQGGAEQNFGPVPCDDAPLFYQGNLNPGITGSFATYVNIMGNFNISTKLDFEGNSTRLYWDGVARCTIYRICEENFFPERASIQRMGEIQQSAADQRSTFMQDASFIKLRSVSIGYNLPSRMTDNLGLRTASVNLTGRNLYTWTGYNGIDPENGVLSSSFGLDQAIVPQLTSFMMSFNVTF